MPNPSFLLLRETQCLATKANPPLLQTYEFGRGLELLDLSYNQVGY